MKIIFLDVDGVLNHSKTPEWIGATHNDIIDRDCLIELDRIITFTNAQLVLSSTWKLNPDKCEKLYTYLAPDIIGATPCLNLRGPRRAEILDWLQTVWPFSFGWHDVITHMAVLDDDADADLGDGSFFKTDFEDGGLTKEIADKIIIHLGEVR